MLKLRRFTERLFEVTLMFGIWIPGSFEARCDTILQKIERHELSVVTESLAQERSDEASASPDRLLTFFTSPDMDEDTAPQTQESRVETALNLNTALPVAFSGDTNQRIAEALLQRSLVDGANESGESSARRDAYVYRISSDTYRSPVQASGSDSGDGSAQTSGSTAQKDAALEAPVPNALYGQGQRGNSHEDATPPPWYVNLFHQLAEHWGASTTGILFAAVYVFLRLKDLFR
ncbi:MAG: hypothetical protein FWD64_00285 [Acidobacteriaceae bacterium]|nr:hypothetical protein [Acidobacteriaceae bacterium]